MMILLYILIASVIAAILTFTVAVCKLNGLLSRDEERIMAQREKYSQEDWEEADAEARQNQE